MKDFQDALDFPFGNQRDSEIADETFGGQEGDSYKSATGLVQVREMDGVPFQCGDTSIALAQPEFCLLQRRRVESVAGSVFQHQGVRVEQQHVCRVDVQLGGYLIEQDVEGEAQVEAGGDGLVDRPQGGNALKMLMGLFVEFGAIDGVRGNVGRST